MAARRRRWYRRYPIIPMVIIAVIIVLALFPSQLAPYDPAAQSLVNRLKPPFWQSGGSIDHILGTDHLGRDVLSRLIYASRVTAIIVLFAVILSAALGTLVGMIAGYFGRAVDATLMRLVDFQLAVPALLFAILLAAVLDPGLKNVIIIVALFTWAGFARLVRAEVLALRNQDFVLLARVAGASPLRIFARHLFPNVLNTVMVLATFEVSVVILFEATLSFLGLGVLPPDISWGQMINDGRPFLLVAWWLITIPGLTILLVAMAGNLFGDWVRDRLDPHLQRAER
jgi:peptide/nickel transport system permease protein